MRRNILKGSVNELCQANKRTFCLLCLKTKEHGKCMNDFYNKKQFLEKLSELKTKIQQDKSPQEMHHLRELTQKANQFIQLLEQFVNDIIHNYDQVHCIQSIDVILKKQEILANDWELGYKMLANQQRLALRDTNKLIDQLTQIQQTIDQMIVIPVDNRMGLVKLNWNNSTFDAKSAIFSLTCSSDGKFVACGCEDAGIRIFKPESGDFVTNLKGHKSIIRALCYSPNNKHIASGCYDNTVRIWNMDQLKQDGKPLTGHTSYVMTVCFSPNGLFIASGSNDKSIRIWNMHDRKLIKCLNGLTSAVMIVDFSPNGKLLASGNDDRTIKLWNTQTWEALEFSLKGHMNSVFGLKFSKDGMNLISGSYDKSLRIWDVETGQELKCFNGHTSYVWPVIYSPDEKFIISGSNDKSIRVWNIHTGESSLMKGHNGFVTQLCISPDGKYLISAGGDSLLQIQKLRI